MRAIRTLFFLPLLLVGATSSRLSAQARPPARPARQDSTRAGSAPRKPGGRILGVFDALSGNPVEGAEVVDLFVDAVYRTEANGLVGLWAFQSRHDSAAVRIRKIGYADTAFVVMVGATDTTPVPVFITKAATLPTVVTDAVGNGHPTANMQEFESRLNDKSLTGRFMTKADLDKHSGKPIGEVFYDLMAGKSRGCNTAPTLFIDGIRMPGATLDTLGMTADNYQGIEFYTPAAAPLRFNATLDPTSSSAGIMSPPKQGNSGNLVAGAAAGPAGSATSIRAASSCGVLVLWRRERP